MTLVTVLDLLVLREYNTSDVYQEKNLKGQGSIKLEVGKWVNCAVIWFLVVGNNERY